MHRHPLCHLLAIAVSWTMPLWAMAQTSRPPKPYAPVAITRPPPFEDSSLQTFRAMLALVAKSRVYAELAPIVVTQGFFWGRDFGQHYDPRRPAVDNLAAAISLESGNGAGWNVLAAFAAEVSAEPLESRPGVLCAPASPGYDNIEFSRLLDITDTSASDWVYPRDDGTAVRSAARQDAPGLGMLGSHLVRMLAFDSSNGNAAIGHEPWTRVALPDGSIGYVAPGRLISLAAIRLCYIQDLAGRWRIAGVISAEPGPSATEVDPAK
jgi:hypothetical protein